MCIVLYFALALFMVQDLRYMFTLFLNNEQSIHRTTVEVEYYSSTYPHTLIHTTDIDDERAARLAAGMHVTYSSGSKACSEKKARVMVEMKIEMSKCAGYRSSTVASHRAPSSSSRRGASTRSSFYPPCSGQD